MNQYFDNNLEVKNEKKLINVTIDNKRYKLYTNNGVFSKDKLDYGSKLLIETMIEQNLTGRVLDLGCGYGVIGTIIANTFSQVTVDMIDVTDRAIELSKENIANLHIENANVFKSNIYDNITTKYNYIITNPPIRAGKDIIKQFLIGAKDHLENNGYLYFVMRKNHGVKSMIKVLENYYVIKIKEKSKGFYVIECSLK